MTRNAILDPVLDVLLSAQEPREDKRSLEEEITRSIIAHIYAGGSIEVVPIGVTAYTYRSQPPNGGIKPTPVIEPLVRSLLPRLPCMSIAACPSITPRLRGKIFLLPASRSMADLRSSLFRQKEDNKLPSVTSTARDLEVMTRAYVSFVDSIATSRDSVRCPSRDVPWVVPSRHLRSVMSRQIRHLPSAVISVLERHDFLEYDPTWAAWLPWVSLGAVNTLRSLPPRTISALSRALSAFVAYMTPTVPSKELWKFDCSPDWLSVPTYAICAFRKEAHVRKALARLASHGIRAIQDLRCLHPDAIRLAKEPTVPLLALYSAFAESRDEPFSTVDVF